MLRYACSSKPTRDGHDTRASREWLDHGDIQHTARYTELMPERFKVS